MALGAGRVGRAGGLRGSGRDGTDGRERVVAERVGA